MDTDIAAVNRIAELGKQAADFAIEKFIPPEEAIGLPASIDFGFNLARGEVRDLSDIAEKWRLFPARRKGTAAVTTLQSFIDLTNRHKTVHSVIFAATTWPGPSLTAVVDYHEIDSRGDPQFCQHRIQYDFPVTDEFRAWADQDGKPMKQGDFASFIEDRVAELADPTEDERQMFEPLFNTKFATPAEMLALSRGLEVNVAAQVKNAVTLQSGEGQIVFVEEHLNANGAKIIVPGLFMISVAAFLDGTPVRLPARLRYRTSGGQIAWFFQLYQWKKFLRDRIVADLLKATMATELPAYEGKPEA